MRFITRVLFGLMLLCGLTLAATAETRIVFVTHGQSGDPYWSVVKNGMDEAAKTLGVNIDGWERLPSAGVPNPELIVYTGPR